jgi:nucleoside-diphosphate-sugar epimerase
MADRRYLVVGGTGYIGARLALDLSRDSQVVVTRRTASPARNEWLQRAGLSAVDFDSARHGSLDVAGTFDAIINLAMPAASLAARDPQASRASALAVAQACVHLLRDGRAARLLHFSSFHVYGGAARSHYDEDTPTEPLHPYGQTHLACEQVVLAQPNTVVLRPSNIVAAPAHADLGEQAMLLVLDLCRQAAHGAMHLNNDGLSYRDFLPFDDVASAVRMLLAGKISGRTLNLAHGKAQRLDEVARLIQHAATRHPTVSFGEGRDSFREPFTISTTRLDDLGWRPSANLADEIRRAISFFA